MIPFKMVLFAWIPFSALLMIARKPARNFALAIVLGMMVLPSGNGITIVGLPDLSKGNVAVLGLFLGTVMFHPDLILRFKPRWSDAFLLLGLAFAVATSVSNGLGVYDGLSIARSHAFAFVLPIFLARIHLDTPKALMTFLTVMVIAAIVYTLPALWEFRMSPQLHTKIYGYFQHSFIQFKRGSFYRPVVCFPHALTLGRYMAFIAFIAMVPMRGYLAQRFPGGRYYFLAPLLCLLLSMSWGPYIMFLSLWGLHYVARRWTAVPYVVPVLAGIWLILVFAGAKPFYGVVDTIASVNPDRAESLKYRLDALEEYRTAIMVRPGLGHGGWGNARTERATDSAFLIQSLSRGLIGALLIYAWWTVAMHNAFKLARRLRGSPMAGVFLAVGNLIAVCMAICAVDDALDYQILFLGGSVLVLEQVMRRMAMAPGAFHRTPSAPAVATGPIYVYD